ncbi:hypothetical protein PoB_000697400 [Plakobranchus ocellatus]|uniref:Uncharacterized protein n=1 Tax=Plakobranchus ocellatus TaxID=259542 RepID=A0AAV3YEG8_9GAST|nr:hypothetical protein PoB_000697400 [Plakobranchus ocellatus]
MRKQKDEDEDIAIIGLTYYYLKRLRKSQHRQWSIGNRTGVPWVALAVAEVAGMIGWGGSLNRSASVDNMSDLGEYLNPIVISDDEDGEDEDCDENIWIEFRAKPSGQYGTPFDLCHRPMHPRRKLLLSHPRPNRDRKIPPVCSTEELPDLSSSPPKLTLQPDFIGQTTAKLQREEIKNTPILKRLSIHLIRCDDQVLALKECEPPSKVSKVDTVMKNTPNKQERKFSSPQEKSNCQNLEAGLSNTSLAIENKIENENSCSDFVSPDNGKKTTINKEIMKASKAEEQSEISRFKFLDENKSEAADCVLLPRRRITEERQAASSPIASRLPLICFHQLAATRHNVPMTRISCQRQAFFSPMKLDEEIQSDHMLLKFLQPFPQCEAILEEHPEDIVQIFHRTIRRKINFPEKFDRYLISSTSLNQMRNLERNRVFGPYWHPYVPSFSFNNSKVPFTEYHDAFIETALEQDENSLEQALSLLKDFKSKRCPTRQSIANIVNAWKTDKLHLSERKPNPFCALVEILQCYPVVASACVDKEFLPLFSSRDVVDTECSLIIASLELDFFTRTLCDASSLRRSLAYSLLSVHKNRENIKSIVHLIEDNMPSLICPAYTPLTEFDMQTDQCARSKVVRVFQLQHLLAIAIETEIWNKVG